eukprot:CAMPEP_0194563182 /NCGR_PEP_ID=MMETSP0292-20121207/3340_1 /TAXON_ID=39354 /ORGANISM="Heterosigma akashiwo, Strain CCMP2393" /LENGTH=32 /DNA_ID= /DNA_START= /DNA_END= /DNA_ORIENTATION=
MSNIASRSDLSPKSKYLYLYIEKTEEEEQGKD